MGSVVARPPEIPVDEAKRWSVRGLSPTTAGLAAAWADAGGACGAGGGGEACGSGATGLAAPATSAALRAADLLDAVAPFAATAAGGEVCVGTARD
jgi:hypothetical protein